MTHLAGSKGKLPKNYEVPTTVSCPPGALRGGLGYCRRKRANFPQLARGPSALLTGLQRHRRFCTVSPSLPGAPLAFFCSTVFARRGGPRLAQEVKRSPQVQPRDGRALGGPGGVPAGSPRRRGARRRRVPPRRPRRPRPGDAVPPGARPRRVVPAPGHAGAAEVRARVCDTPLAFARSSLAEAALPFRLAQKASAATGMRPRL